MEQLQAAEQAHVEEVVSIMWWSRDFISLIYHSLELV